LNDEYPDILKAMNDYREYLAIDVRLSKEPILEILQSFVINKRDVYTVRLTLKNNNLSILSLNNNSEANITTDYNGNEYTIDFNALYLLEAIDNIDSDNVLLRLPSRNDYAAYIEPVNNCGCLALIMPMAWNI